MPPEDETGPAADPHGLKRADQGRRGLRREHDGDIGKTGAEGDEKCRAVGFGSVGSPLRHAAPRNQNAAGDDDGHRRPLDGARVHAHCNVDGEHERRMRGDDRRDHGNRPSRDANIEQHAHPGDAHAMENGDRDAELRPDEDLAACKEPERRPDRTNQEDEGIGQERAERPRAEPRHEVGGAKAKSARKAEKRRDHARPLRTHPGAWHPLWFCKTRAVVVEFPIRPPADAKRTNRGVWSCFQLPSVSRAMSIGIS